jgi:hypothetical protein
VRYLILTLLLGVALTTYGGYVAHRYAQPVALILEAETPLREAPYGTASAATSLEQASMVRIESRWGFWTLVSHGAFRGWVRSSEMVTL